MMPLASQFIRVQISNGRSTLFWLDQWLPLGRLIDMVGDAEPHRLGVGCYAKFADVANESGWQFRRCRDPNLQKIILSISGVQPPVDGSAEDNVLWRSGTDLYDCRLSKEEEGESVDPTLFKSLVGSLRYLTCTRPDILHAVGVVSRYMEHPTTTNYKAAKRILCYIKGTINFDLYYSISDDYKLVGYSDSDWGGDIDDRKSTSGFVLFIRETTFTWMSKKQPIVTLSTCEAEYVAATSCVCDAIWLRNLL
ncbi:hypothetical protein YC2023_017941 [Brassica napus]